MLGHVTGQLFMTLQSPFLEYFCFEQDISLDGHLYNRFN